jgi:hypothetical protein
VPPWIFLMGQVRPILFMFRIGIMGALMPSQTLVGFVGLFAVQMNQPVIQDFMTMSLPWTPRTNKSF